MTGSSENVKLRVNIIVVVLAVAELVFILAYFLPKFIDIDQQSKQLEQDIKCVDCCQSLAFKQGGNCDALCGTTKSCKNWAFGFLERGRKRSYQKDDLKKAVRVAIREEANVGWSGVVKNNAKDETKVKHQMSEIERTVLNGNRSYAHLTCDGQPKLSRKSGNVVPQWEYRESAGFAVTSGNIGFSRDTGIITILKNGIYIIYIHSTFAPTWDEGNAYKDRNCCSIIYPNGSHHKKHARPCSIKKPKVEVAHEVIKLNSDSTKHKILLRASDLISPTVEFNQCHHRLEGITPIGIDSLDTIGTFNLVKGDKLVVNYQFPPDQIMLGSHEAETYFGIYQM